MISTGVQSRCRDLEDFLGLIRADSHILLENPGLLFQQAANQPDIAFPAKAASLRVKEGLEKRPWLSWVNKPQERRNASQVLSGHKTRVTACAFSPDGRRIVSGADDGILLVWDPESGRSLSALSGHTRGITSIVFSRDGRRFASASEDGTVRVWDSDGLCLRQLRGHRFHVTACAFSPDGEWLASSSRDGTLKIWRLDSGEESESFGEGLSDREIQSGSAGRQFRYLTACAFSGDGLRIMSGNGGGGITLWERESGREISTKQAHQGPIVLCRFLDEGDRLLTVSTADGIKRWTGEECSEILSFAPRNPQYRFGHEEAVSVALSPDLQTVAFGCRDGSLNVGNLTKGAEWRKIGRHGAAVLACAFSPDGRSVLSALDDGTLGVWIAPEPGRQDAASPSVPAEESLGWRFSPDRTHIEPLYGSETDQVSHPYDHLGRLDPLPDGGHFIARHYKWLIVGEFSSGAILRTLEHDQNVDAYDISQNGLWIATVSGGIVRIWDSATWTMRDVVPQCGQALACAFSPDGNRLAWGNKDGSIGLWQLARREARLFRGGHGPFIRAIGFSPDGERLLSSSGDPTLKLWDVETCADVAVLRGHEWDINMFCFSPDGRRIATTSRDHTVRIWNGRSGRETAVLRGHRHSVNGCRFSPDGRLLGSVSYDRSLIVWAHQEGRPLCEFRFGERAEELDWLQKDNSLVSRPSRGPAVLLELKNTDFGPCVITPWRDRSLEEAVLFACPSCRNWNKGLSNRLGTEIACRHCGKRLLLNGFATPVDLGQMAAAASPSPRKRQGGQKKKPGRDDPCPCGSGKKYSKCHGAPR